MARNCNCAGGSCGCLVVGGTGIDVTGIGTKQDPFVILNKGVSVKNALTVVDTPTLNMHLTGEGTPSEPLALSADVRMSLSDLTNVSKATPDPGDVPVWTVAGGVGEWQYNAPPTTPPGAVTVTTGLQGDGSGPNPLRARTSGTFGSGTLAGYGADAAAGAPIYTDASGALRGAPWGSLPRYSTATRPTARPGVMVWDTTIGAAMVGNAQGTDYELISSATPVGMLMQYPVLVAPVGWLPCDGATYLRTLYPRLAALLGARGEVVGDATRFRVPDLRGRVAVGVDATQAEFNEVGKRGGSKAHTLTIAEMPAHSHTETFNSARIATEASPPQVGGMTSSGGLGTTVAEQSTLKTGGGLPHNNLQPYETVYYLIRAL